MGIQERLSVGQILSVHKPSLMPVGLPREQIESSRKLVSGNHTPRDHGLEGSYVGNYRSFDSDCSMS